MKGKITESNEHPKNEKLMYSCLGQTSSFWPISDYIYSFKNTGTGSVFPKDLNI